ncbi:GSCOCG00009816001-RA-CDS, partial [Cotesia congregata]
VEQEKKIESEEYWAAIHRAATIIQGAWRGIMVRKQLGRFKNLWKVLEKRKKLALKRKKKNKKLKKKKSLKS